MKLTKRWLIKHNACKEGVEWFDEQKDKTNEALIKACLKDGHFDWANWVITRELPKKVARVKYAVYAANLVLKIYEDKYPNDKRPRKALAAAKKYIKNPTTKTACAAYAACADAADAAYDAYAADAAYDADAADAADAAYDACAAAACAAYAACAAAARAARAARAAAIDKKINAKIIMYGYKLLMEKKA